MPNIVLSYCPWDTEKGARGYIALHHLYIMAQEGILRKYPLPHDTLQFISCPDITPFYEHSVKLQTIHSHTWASSSIIAPKTKEFFLLQLWKAFPTNISSPVQEILPLNMFREMELLVISPLARSGISLNHHKGWAQVLNFVIFTLKCSCCHLI